MKTHRGLFPVVSHKELYCCSWWKPTKDFGPKTKKTKKGLSKGNWYNIQWCVGKHFFGKKKKTKNKNWKKDINCTPWIWGLFSSPKPPPPTPTSVPRSLIFLLQSVCNIPMHIFYWNLLFWELISVFIRNIWYRKFLIGCKSITRL